MIMETTGSAISQNESEREGTAGEAGASGGLAEETLSNITKDNERARAAFTSPDGLTRVDGDEQRHVAVPVVMVVTDRRVVFVSRGPTGEVRGDTGSLPYAELAAVAVVDDATLDLRTVAGVTWRFPLPETNPETVEAVIRHLRWVGTVRNEVIACRNDVELAAGEIRDAAAEMSWEAAEATYERLRERLDRVIGTVQRTTPVADEALAPELTGTERTLERAYARLYLERAASQLELGGQLVQSGNYEQAEAVLGRADEYRRQARRRADAVERGDAFRFGEQRELRDDLEELAWEIETVAAEPIRRAHEAKVLALDTAETETAVAHWEEAFERYDQVLDLGLGEGERRFVGDPERVEQQRRAAATHLVDGHRRLARQAWETGVECERDDEYKSAISACADAAEHMERATELAERFDHEDAAEIATRTERMAAALRRIRATATVERDRDERFSAENAAEPEPDEESGATTPLTAEEISEIDTHHEIAFDLTDPTETESETDETPESEEKAEWDVFEPATAVDDE
jgi:tetratricopeptide (TPR) repeat protein